MRKGGGLLRATGGSVIRRTMLLWVLAAMAAVPAAHAAYPGQNGKIAAAHNSGLTAVHPETGASDPIGGGAEASHPAWSPNGSRVAYTTDSQAGGTQPGDIHVIGADGNGDVTLAADPAMDSHPSWSPDGSRIVFDSTRDGGFGVRELYVMDADGTNVQRLTNLEELEGQAHSPAWSPDGTQIAYIGRISTLPRRLRIINVDGTGDHAITPEDFRMVSVPDWAPDASRIMVEGGLGEDPDEFFTVEPDGSNLAPLPNTADDVDGGGGIRYSGPAFSPDGTRIVFVYRGFIPNASGVGGLMSQRVDGTDRRTVVTGTSVSEFYVEPDWQPIPVNSYPRPAGATPMHVALVVAYPKCTTPNRIHGPPLEHPSCRHSYPAAESQHVTVGTPDSNGAPAKFIGTLRIGVQVGNPATPADEADLRLTVSTTDARCWPYADPAICGVTNVVGNDYVGELQARVVLQITDKNNMPAPNGPGAATTIEMPYSFDMPCTETPDDDFIGSACEVDTTADALIPGTIKEGARAIWQLGQVEVLDGGPDGDVDTPAGAMVFLRQGIFVP
jgi:hypothetical protein